MLCCINPDCNQPYNVDSNKHCQNCGTPLLSLLRHRYRILKPLGRGGFGKTYLAEDIDKLNEHCVVKQLAYQGHGTQASRKAIQLFEEEARQLQRLSGHPQIPTLLAYFQEGQYLYLVQQFVEGQDLLKELQQQGGFSEDKIRELLINLLPVLTFIHGHHIIHRDIKPENIMHRKKDNKMVLIDFGVAKMLASSIAAHTGTILGSHGYAPLEQIREGKATSASDLFSLGATCFHLLTHIPPFQLWAEQGYGWVVNWQQHLPTPVSPHLVAILDKLLQKDIEQRYQSSNEVLQDLQSQPIEFSKPQVTSAQGKHQTQASSSLKTTVSSPSKTTPSLLPLPMAIAVLGILSGTIVAAINWFNTLQPQTRQANPAASPNITPPEPESPLIIKLSSSERFRVDSAVLVASELQTALPKLDRQIQQGSIVYAVNQANLENLDWLQLKVCTPPAAASPSPISPSEAAPGDTPEVPFTGADAQVQLLLPEGLGWIRSDRYQQLQEVGALTLLGPEDLSGLGEAETVCLSDTEPAPAPASPAPEQSVPSSPIPPG